ncbi:MAG: zinc ribbon domain-containing protein [Clostridiaceae bacterium]|nr:zinc ribbon domain-containing protein [Clostridiaceae bacterium]
MSIEIIELNCPNCGASVSLETKVCEYCGSPVIIRTVTNSFASLKTQKIGNASENLNGQKLSEAIGFLRAKLYERANLLLESVIQEDFNNSDAHFYAAIACLKGKRPFLVSTSVIKKSEEYLKTATAIEPKGIYFYLWAYIKLDHYSKKFYKTSPSYTELYSMAKNAGLSPTDVNELYGILDVERPSEF